MIGIKFPQAISVRKLFSLARPAIANTLLVFASVLFCYVAMEYALFRVIFPIAPLDIRSQLPEIAEVLAQTSKSAPLPHEYIALFGDSYAEGLGDWLLETGGKRDGPFHSADVIHQLTGRDVVNLGVGGAGSAEAIVLRPARAFLSSGCSVFPKIDRPRQIFVYFYEGNDIEDNIRFAGKVSRRYGRMDAETIDRYLAEQYGVSSLLRCHGSLAETTFKLAESFVQYAVTGASIAQCGSTVASKNRLVVGERTIDAPALQGPAPHLPDESIRLGMEVLAHSLSWLRQRFEGLPITVVYVPSPLSVYRHAGDMIAFCSASGAGPAQKAVSERHHDLMRDMVAGISADQGIDFIDATPALRAAADTGVVHGPRDWDHLNKTGYQILGALVVSRVRSRQQE